MQSPRFATSLATLCLTTLSAVTACAQWVPCTSAGVAIISPVRDNNNCYPMYGLLTGGGSGSQSIPPPPQYPNRTLYQFNPMAATSYDPYNAGSQDLNMATTTTASNGMGYDGNSDSYFPVSSKAVCSSKYSWNAYFVWQGQNPPVGPSANFLIVTTVSASAGRADMFAPDPGGMTAWSTASNEFGEAETAQYVSGKYVNKVMTGHHIVNVPITRNSRNGLYSVSVHFSGGADASAANNCTTWPNGSLVSVGSSAFIGGGVLPQ